MATKLTPSPPSPREPPSPPAGARSRVMCWALSRVRWCWGKRVKHTLARSSPTPSRTKGVCDEWFVDDGQVFARPFQFDPFLRAPDAALRVPGGTRRTCTTPLTSSPQRPASTSMHERGSQCEPLTRCALRLAVWIMPPPRWSSSGI